LTNRADFERAMLFTIGSRTELGRDDHLAKPLASRNSSLAFTKLCVARWKKARICHRGLKLDLLSRSVQRNGQTIELTARDSRCSNRWQNPGRVLPGDDRGKS
jgi:DNA-binding response OmpR family regulator